MIIGYLISLVIIFFFRAILGNKISEDFLFGPINFGYIFVYPLFWSLFNYYIAAFFYNWIAIAKYMQEEARRDKIAKYMKEQAGIKEDDDL